MPAKKTTQLPVEPQRYLQHLSRRWVWGSLAVLTVVAVVLFLCVPHYKPLKLATAQDINQAHEQIIKQYFLSSTTCSSDNLNHAARVAAFNRYLKVNMYANRAVIRGCNDGDSLLAKMNDGSWQRTNVNIILTSRQNPEWQRACLIDDITAADSKVRPENSSIDANNLAICNALRKQSYVAINFSIHFHK